VETSAVLLRTARERAGLSQSDLARRSGIAQSVVSAYEAGRRQPALPTLAKMVEATGHTLAITLQRSDPSVRAWIQTVIATTRRASRMVTASRWLVEGGG